MPPTSPQNRTSYWQPINGVNVADPRSRVVKSFVWGVPGQRGEDGQDGEGVGGSVSWLNITGPDPTVNVALDTLLDAIIADYIARDAAVTTATANKFRSDNTVYLDAAFGVDGTGTRERFDLPFQTPAAARTAANNGDLIQVRPASFSVTTSLAKPGVSWLIPAGTTVDLDQDGVTNVDLFGDGGVSTSYKIDGQATLSISGDVADSGLNSWNGPSVIKVEHASSNVSVRCWKIITTSVPSGDGTQSNGVYQSAGVLEVVADVIDGSAGGYGTWWENGKGEVKAREILGLNYAVGAHVTDTPTGDWWIWAGRIHSTSIAIEQISTNDEAKLWVICPLVEGDQAAVFVEGGKLYLVSEKVSGQGTSIHPVVSVTGGQTWITTQKISAETETAIKVTGGELRVTAQQIEDVDEIVTAIDVSGGYCELNDVVVVLNSGNGLVLSGGTVRLRKCVIDTTAGATANPVVISSGLLILENCTLRAHSSRNAVESTGGTIRVEGTLTTNRPIDGDVTYDGGGVIAPNNYRLTLTASGTFPQDLSGYGLLSGTLAQFAATSSAQLRGVMSDETGTGLLYFQGGDVGTPSAIVLTNATSIPAGQLTGTIADARLSVNVPILVGGLLPTSTLPPLAISQPFAVASEAAMLALSAQRGDVAIRSDVKRTYILSTDSPTTLADWLVFETPTDSVLSVNGQTGTVILGFADVGAQQSDATLTALAGQTITANSLIVGTGADAFTITAVGANQFLARSSSGNLAAKDITDFAFSLLDDANEGAARTTLGGTTAGQAVFTITNPGAIAFLRWNADNTVTSRSASELRSDLSLAELAILATGATNKTPIVRGGTPVYEYPAGDWFTATDGATVTFNWSDSLKQTVTLGGNRTLAFSNDVTRTAITIELVQDGTGSRTVTWPSGIKWRGTGGVSTAPTLSTAIGARDHVTILKVGTGDYVGWFSKEGV